MPYQVRWAYDFSCELTPESICERFNAAGPWQWQQRDNYIFGNYLNSRPAEGLRLRVNEFPQAFLMHVEEGFAALLEISDDSQADKGEVDLVFRELLNHIAATDVAEIDPYD